MQVGAAVLMADEDGSTAGIVEAVVVYTSFQCLVSFDGEADWYHDYQLDLLV